MKDLIGHKKILESSDAERDVYLTSLPLISRRSTPTGFRGPPIIRRDACHGSVQNIRVRLRLEN